MIDVIKYDTEKYNFRKYFEDSLGHLEDLHLNHDIKPVTYSTAGGVHLPEEDTQYGLIEKLYKEVVHESYPFRFMWWEFQKDVVKSWFGENVVIQQLPSIKIFPSGYDWKFYEDTTLINGREASIHYEMDFPFHHPKFETNFIIPLTDMDEDNGIFVEGVMQTPKQGEMVVFDQVLHGGYVHNKSKNTRVSMDFKACGWSEYNNESLSDIKVRKRGKWQTQKELFKIGNYYTIL
jgi:hypothetical protein